MELNELKSLWEDLSQKVDRQKLLTDQLIIEMTQERYTNKFRKMYLYEILGTAICFLSALFILLNIAELNTWYLLACGIVCLVLLTILPIVSLKAILKAKKLQISGNDIKKTLITFYRAKKEVLQTQQMNFYLSILFALAVLPVFSKIMKGKDLFLKENTFNLWIYIPILLIFLVVFGTWVYRSYKNLTTSAEKIIKELEN